MVNNLLVTLSDINSMYEDEKKGFGSLAWISIDMNEEDGDLKFTPDK